MPPGVDAGQGLRLYRGNGFTIEIPPEWIDRSVHTFCGPADRDFIPSLWVVPDLDPGTDDIKVYARHRIETILHTASGSRLALEKTGQQGEDGPCISAEIRWYPTDRQRLYQRLRFLLAEGVGFTLSAELTKRARATAGTTVDRMLDSFRSRRPRGEKPKAPEGGCVYEADSFHIVLEPGWEPETSYILCEPAPSAFRRTILVRSDPVSTEGSSVEEILQEQMETLKSTVPGFEFIDEQRVTLGPGGQGRITAFRRLTAKENKVRQDQLLMIANERLYSITLTSQTAVADDVRSRLASCVASFRTVGPAAGSS